MRLPDWKSILAFCLVETNTEAAVSHFKNLTAITTELERLEWTNCFDFLQDAIQPDPVVAPQDPAPEENLPQPQENIKPAPEPIIAPPPQEHPVPIVNPPDLIPERKPTRKEIEHIAVRKAILEKKK